MKKYKVVMTAESGVTVTINKLFDTRMAAYRAAHRWEVWNMIPMKKLDIKEVRA